MLTKRIDKKNNKRNLSIMKAPSRPFFMSLCIKYINHNYYDIYNQLYKKILLYTPSSNVRYLYIYKEKKNFCIQLVLDFSFLYN